MFKFLKSILVKLIDMATIEETLIDIDKKFEGINFEESIEEEIKEKETIIKPLEPSYKVFKEKILKGFRVISFFGDNISDSEESEIINKGIDIGAHNYRASLIFSPLDGCIIKYGYDVFHGGYVSIHHGEVMVNSKKSDLIITYYGIDNRLEPDQLVIKAGEPIGKLSDKCKICKLHMEVSLDGELVDPLPFIVDSYESEEIKHPISEDQSNHYVLEIKRLQEEMYKLGLYISPISGKVNETTSYAIKLFQERCAGIKEPTEIFDKNCREALKKMNNR